MKIPPISNPSNQNYGPDPITELQLLKSNLSKDWNDPSKVEIDMKAIETFIFYNKAAIIAECKKNGWTGKEMQNFNSAIDGLFQDLNNFETASQERGNTTPMQDQFNENLSSLLWFMTTPKGG